MIKITQRSFGTEKAGGFSRVNGLKSPAILAKLVGLLPDYVVFLILLSDFLIFSCYELTMKMFVPRFTTKCSVMRSQCDIEMYINGGARYWHKNTCFVNGRTIEIWLRYAKIWTTATGTVSGQNISICNSSVLWISTRRKSFRQKYKTECLMQRVRFTGEKSNNWTSTGCELTGKWL